MLSRLRAADLLWPTLLVIPALAVLLGLGTWQMSRKAWKEEIIATIAARAEAPPVEQAQVTSLTCQPADDGLAQSCEYQRVRLKGRFDHDGERHVFAGAQGSGPQAEVGYWVFTPFLPAGDRSGGVTYVNRGFVPERLKAPGQRAAGQVAGDVEIVAQIRTRELRSRFAGANDPARNTYFVRNPAELAGGSAAAGNSAGRLIGNPLFYLELVQGAPPGGYPKPLAASISLPNRHLEYALTWYGLALTLVGVFAAFARGRLRAPANTVATTLPGNLASGDRGTNSS